MRPLRFAIIGTGNIGRIQAEAMARIPDARLTVVCNRGSRAGMDLAKAHGAEWFPHYQDAVQHPEVDVVSICTPSGTHAEIAETAAAAGKHLLVEKPLDITLPRVDRILSAASRANVTLASVFPLRFMKGVRQVKQALDAGRLGRLTMADAYVKWYRPPAYYEVGWRGTWKLDGGGALMNQSIHSIDLLQWLAGPVDYVFARTATLSHDIETEDTATALLGFAHGGMGVIQGATSCWPGTAARIELQGPQGTIVLEEGRIVTWQLADADDEEEAAMLSLEAGTGSGSQDPAGIGSENHRQQILDLIEAIHGDRAPAVAGDEGRKAVEIVRAIYRSATTGMPVQLPLADDG
ncbi:MAG: Gfo/Idh/MocA family oxidoreductase [Caldilineaceae bacterium SB0665_bin_21]|nr:Gfo/Idh/MocA family oxidoreductase [Caldilineaceae bacterium SB0665_bin_21]